MHKLLHRPPKWPGRASKNFPETIRATNGLLPSEGPTRAKEIAARLRPTTVSVNRILRSCSEHMTAGGAITSSRPPGPRAPIAAAASYVARYIDLKVLDAEDAVAPLAAPAVAIAAAAASDQALGLPQGEGVAEFPRRPTKTFSLCSPGMGVSPPTCPGVSDSLRRVPVVFTGP